MKNIPITTKIEAVSVAHTLSNPSKMPCKAYSLPAGDACPTGRVLRKIKGSVCEKCYACRGAYGWPSTVNALEKRLKAIDHPQWPEAMVKLIGNKKNGYFRWFDSGDLQNLKMLCNIVTIAMATPNVKHWLPTKEHALVREYLDLHSGFPANLCIRVSSPMVDQKPLVTCEGVNTSTVHNKKSAYGHICPAPLNDNACGKCRKCWNKSLANISYHEH